MNQIIIGKDVAYAAKQGGGTITGYNEIDLLADGAIAVFSETGQLLTTSNVPAALADCKRVYFVSGSNDGTSSPMPAADISVLAIRAKASFVKKAYVAPVKVRKFIGENTSGDGDLNLPSPLVAGTEAFIRITDTSLGLITTGNKVKRYSTLVTASSTANSVVEALVTAINDDADAIVTATEVGTGAGIKLDAKNFGVTFAISLDGILADANIDESETSDAAYSTSDAVEINYGTGTSGQVKAIEDEFSAQKGNTNKIHQSALWFNKPSKVVTGETYNIYSITWTGEKALPTGSISTVTHEIIVAAPNLGTGEVAFETIMEEVFGDITNVESGS